jgi:hypothetical protein
VQAAPAQLPLLHTRLKQSVATAQADPVPQPGQLPPQSTPVSSPFRVLSVHVGAGVMQTWPTQTRPAQSVFTPQRSPSKHGPQLLPPQSMSDSVPLRTPSSQPGAAHVPSRQTPLWQSVPTAHADPTSQPAQLPPQSTPVSAPFFRPSAHVAGGVEHAPLTQRWPAQSPSI